MKFTGLTCVLMLSFNASSIWAEEQTDAYATHHELGLQQGFPPPQEKQVTQDNALISAPFNRYSYQNMREFYPTVNIPPSSNPRPLKVSPDGGIERLNFVSPDGQTVSIGENFGASDHRPLFVEILCD